MVTGVDIASSMLTAARATNRHGERVRYVHNEQPSARVRRRVVRLRAVGAGAAAGVRPDYAAGYLREFLRLLRPGGVLFCQIPIEPLAPAGTSGAAGATSEPRVEVSTLRARTSLLPPQVALAAGDWQWFRVEVQNAGAIPLPAAGVELGLRSRGRTAAPRRR